MPRAGSVPAICAFLSRLRPRRTPLTSTSGGLRSRRPRSRRPIRPQSRYGWRCSWKSAPCLASTAGGTPPRTRGGDWSWGRPAAPTPPGRGGWGEGRKSRTARPGPGAGVAVEEALTLARQAGDVGTQAAAVGELAMIESFSGDDAAALRMFAQASALARQAGAYRSLLFVAVNESHVLGGLGEHERAAHVARTGIASAHEYGLARSTGTFLAINVAEP